jgi:hypothetical protein
VNGLRLPALRRRPGHGEHHGQDRHERDRPGANAPGQQHARSEGQRHDQHAERQRMAAQQRDQHAGDQADRRAHGHAPPDARRRVRRVGQAGEDGAARGEQRGTRTTGRAGDQLHQQHAQRHADAVQHMGRQVPGPAPDVADGLRQGGRPFAKKKGRW